MQHDEKNDGILENFHLYAVLYAMIKPLPLETIF